MDVPALPAGSLHERLRPPRSALQTGLSIAAAVAFVVLMTWAWIATEMRPFDLIYYWRNSAEFIGGFANPDFRGWWGYVKDMVITVHIALWGTFLAVIAAVPCGLLSSANIAPWWIHQPMRRLMDACRAIHEMIFALIFVVAVGLGPFAGIMALFVHTTGILAKLFSEVVESIDPQPVEGVKATGATRMEEVRYGVIPQVLPLWISYSLYRFESNVRSASVLGIVGAGGIGMALHDLSASFMYERVAVILLILVASVTIIDLISAQVRRMLV